LSIVDAKAICRNLQEETRKLELKIQEEKRILAKKQQAEMQIQLDVEAIEVQKALHAPQDHEHQKSIKELQKKLLDVKDDFEMQTNMVNALTAKYMTTNCKLQDAKKTSIAIGDQCPYL
jgi:chromosome segregation ATPase